MEESLEFRYDTQLLIEGTGLDEDEITAFWRLATMNCSRFIFIPMSLGRSWSMAEALERSMTSW